MHNMACGHSVSLCIVHVCLFVCVFGGGGGGGLHVCVFWGEENGTGLF